MSLDLGNTPSGSPPNASEREQLRIASGLGASVVTGLDMTIYVDNMGILTGLYDTVISDDAFSFGDLVAIHIGHAVQTIGSGAFYYCSSLEALTLPSRLTSIGDSAFRFCGDLGGTLVLPHTVSSIGALAFASCGALTRIEIHAPVAPTIGSQAFLYCSNVSSALIHVPVGATGYASDYDGLTVVYDL